MKNIISVISTMLFMKRILFILTFLMVFVCLYAAEPDILVTQTGESIKVYNLDITSGDKVYYTLQDSENAPLQKILKSDVLIIKKADGTKIDSSNLIDKVSESKRELESYPQVNPNAHNANTVKAIESDFTEIYIKPYKGIPLTMEDSSKKFSNVVGNHNFILADDGTGLTLNFRLVSKDRKELALSFPRKGDKYDYETIEIPEYVNINDEIYTVTEIDSRTFGEKGAEKIANIIFPKTLKRIHSGAFVKCVKLQSIELPESVEEIAMGAFIMAGSSCKTFRQVYIPKNIKTIGEGAFQFVGPNTSYRGYYQGALTSIPDWITVGNCTNYGIDENAIEDYKRKIELSK